LKPTREAIEHRAIEMMQKGENETDCDFCDFDNCSNASCAPMLVKAALERAKKELSKSPLTDDEKAILRNLDKQWKYIGRNEDNSLSIAKKDFIKSNYYWVSDRTADFPFDHLFQFIKWEDEEPYSIEELLNEAD